MVHFRMSSSNNFVAGKKKKNKLKGFSLESGIAKLALTATTNLAVGVIGVEEIIHQNLCSCEAIDDVSSESIMKYVADNVIGKDLVYKGPFGSRKVVYCDYTASGKSVQFIEDYIRDEVLPYYGNTHTTTTVSSLHTSNLRTEAKQIIRKCTNATEDDAVIFVSSGTTGAIGKLIHALKLQSAPVVFISPYEHHSNLLPWLEIGAVIVYGEETPEGMIDLIALEKVLKEYSVQGRPMIGSFSAASNITGILTDVDSISILLHRYGAYAFFDYATAGPYVEIDMNSYLKHPNKDPMCYKDAMFCSIHKFVGGPGTPGLLVAKKNVFINPVPSGVGGGTVLFVTHKKHHYVDDVEEREEGGTPAIVESIRAGLVFQLKQEVSPEKILKREHLFLKMAYKRWEKIPTLNILGRSDADRLPIFALVVSHEVNKKYVHHNFVSALLNDLFGVQARGGCACAGPYAEDLLGIDNEMAVKIADSLLGDYTAWSNITEEELVELKGKTFNILKPGFCRLNLPYFSDEATIEYILESVAFVAEHGWKFLPMYSMNPETGDFKHRRPFTPEKRAQLSDMKKRFSVGSTSIKKWDSQMKKEKRKSLAELKTVNFDAALQDAKKMLADFMNDAQFENDMEDTSFLPPELSKLMTWFLLPHEAQAAIKGNPLSTSTNYIPMFRPRENNENKKKLSRKRLKSGFHNSTFCTCPKQKQRHVKTSSCFDGHGYKLRYSFRKDSGKDSGQDQSRGIENNGQENSNIEENNNTYHHISDSKVDKSRDIVRNGSTKKITENGYTAELVQKTFLEIS